MTKPTDVIAMPNANRRALDPNVGWRFDGGKNKLDLIPPEWLWGLGQVMTYGASKYADRNWEKGMRWGICVACALRHIVKWLAGERNDPESGLHHLLHAAWNCLALVTYEVRGIGEDDRPRCASLRTVEPQEEKK